MPDVPRPRPTEPLTQQNTFLQQAVETAVIPSFLEARARLPEPVLADKPAWVEMYWRAWELVWANLRRPRPDTGLVASHVNGSPENHLFMWDAAFEVQYGVYGRRIFPFVTTLDNFYARQHPDGYMCREMSWETGQELYAPFDPDGTGPAILAWAEWRTYRASGDDARLARVFWPLLAYHHWCRANRTWPSGLYWATGVSSGMSNQPRVPDSRHHHRHWTWVDASMQAALTVSVLAQMAGRLQEADWAEALTAEHTQLVQKINQQLWNEEQTYYQDVGPDGRFSRVKSIGAYWGLVDKELVPADRLTPFVQHLRDGWAFNLPHRVPSQAADSEGYNAQSGNRWRGAVWPATNFMVLKGLRTVGQHALAREIALNHLGKLFEVYQRTDTFWENYAPETAAPGDPAQPNAVSMAAISPIAILLEDVLGLHVDWPLRRVTWDRQLETAQLYGVRNFPIGPDGVVDLIADPEKLTVNTNVPFTLQLREDGQLLQAAVPVGTTEIDLT
ncbi:MAG: hypothetical protein KC425_01785 [Anaerolineales bacterium]|nr:hypothetical protein [Anaerolineales bacterium]